MFPKNPAILPESNDLYFKLAFDESLIAKVLIGLDQRFLKVNRAACSLLGYSEAELLTKTFSDVSHPEDIAPTFAALQPLFEGQRSSVQMEKRFIHKDGKIVWALVNSVLIRDADGTPLYRITEGQDITERKLMEEKLREAEARFRILSESSKMAIYIIQDGVFQYVNPAMAESLMYRIEELQGSSPFRYVHPEDVALVQEKFDLRLSGLVEHVDYEVRFVRKDGQILYGHAHGGTALLGGRRALIGNVVDITERKHAEDALRQSEAKFRAIIENSSDSFLFCSTDCIISYLSSSYEKLSGYRNEEWVGRIGFEAVHPDDLEMTRRVWDQVIQHPENSFTVQYRILHKNGLWLWIESTVQNLMNNPDVQSVIIISHDIAQRKQAEEMLRQQMEENLRRTRELEAITQVSINMRQAQSRAEMIDVLLADSTRILGAQGAAMGLLNGKSLVMQGATGLAAECHGHSISQNNGLYWQVIQSGTPRFMDEHSAEMLLLNEIGSGIIAPLKSGEITIGTFFWGYTTSQPVSADQRRLAIAIAEMAGVALHRVSMSEALEKIVVDRSHELQTIYRVTASASPSMELHSAIHNALELILPSVRSGAGAVLLWDEQGQHFNVIASQGLPGVVIDYLERTDNTDSLEARVLANRQPLIVADGTASERLPYQHPGQMHLAVLPMTAGERTIGVLDVIRQEGEPFNLEELTLLAFIADHLGLVVENSMLFRQVEDHAILEERARMARALHDSVTQLLYSIVLYAEGTNRLAGLENWEQVRTNLAELSQMTNQALKEMRLMVYELRSPALHHDGLVKAVQHRLDTVEIRSGIHATILADHLPTLPERMEEAIYRITLEALNNSLKHAHAKNITVFIRYQKKKLHLCVRDDGEGFWVEEKTRNGGMGITGMKERVERLNGRLDIHSTPGSGCEVEAVIPISVQRTTRRSPR